MYCADGLQEHLVLGLEVSQPVANLLRHAVVVFSVASLYESGEAEWTFDSQPRWVVVSFMIQMTVWAIFVSPGDFVCIGFVRLNQ